MSQASQEEEEKKKSLVKGLVEGLPLFAAFFVTIIFAVIGYMIGNFLGTQMGVTQLFGAGSTSGLYAIFYNTTHQPIYDQLAQVAYAAGINIYTQDVNVLGITGLGLGFIVGLLMGIRVYEQLE